ncbi:c-type cytochrome [Methyloversatilis thermotolerans]|uniref:c-type cytochrome n=1 Tax=Methyloversatilis thermotolerans TaxID=1346290 RepID=UPI00037616DD|nr:c-type cytochrome [Methyloversatilis thermotolerans]
MKRLCATVLLALGASAGAADPSMQAEKPKTDLSALPALGERWLESNPYRDNPAVIATGRALFNESCAICHGMDGNPKNQPGPNLLRLHRGCQKVSESGLLKRCLSDVDHYFVKSVRHGKRVLDVQHMPPWEGVMPQEGVWAIKTFIEARIAEKLGDHHVTSGPAPGP